MAVMLSKTYTALVNAGAEDAVAIEAAEEIAAFEGRLAGIETRLAKIDGDIRLVKWMLGLVIAAVFFPLIKDLLQ